MKPKRKCRPDLSAAEWDVMKVIWDHGPLAARDIFDHLSGTKRWAYPTVKTLVRRMVEKGWLDYDRIGNSFLYRPAVSRKKALRRAVVEFSNRALDGLLSPFVAYYVEQKDLSTEDLRQLEAILKKHGRRGGNNAGK